MKCENCNNECGPVNYCYACDTVLRDQTDPRDRELAVLRAQVRVLIRRVVYGEQLQRDWADWSRQQAEKEVDRESKV